MSHYSLSIYLSLLEQFILSDGLYCFFPCFLVNLRNQFNFEFPVYYPADKIHLSSCPTHSVVLKSPNTFTELFLQLGKVLFYIFFNGFPEWIVTLCSSQWFLCLSLFSKAKIATLTKQQPIFLLKFTLLIQLLSSPSIKVSLSIYR